jgi:hypothetical protein
LCDPDHDAIRRRALPVAAGIAMGERPPVLAVIAIALS